MADLLLRSPQKYEPKTKNRWLLRFPNDVNIQPWQSKTVSAPKKEYQTKEMRFINSSSFVNTSYKWAPMNVTVRDFIAPSTSEALMEWARLHAESATGRMGYAVGYAKDILLDTLDPTGVVIEQWLLKSSILTGTIDFGDWSYDDDEVRDISFTIQPWYCLHLFG